jgi:hypothetical protein
MMMDEQPQSLNNASKQNTEQCVQHAEQMETNGEYQRESISTEAMNRQSLI